MSIRQPHQPVAGDVARPRDGFEARLCAMFADATGVSSVGPDSNFFSLGGRGLKAMRLAAMVREIYGVDLPLHILLANPTPAALASMLDQLPKAKYTRHGSFDLRMIRPAGKAMPSGGAILCMPQLGGGDDYANIVAASCLRQFDLWSCRFYLEGDEAPYNKTWVACALELATWLLNSKNFSPVALLGFSAGGYTAWLVDRLLVAAGRNPAKLINLDGGPAPIYYPELRARISSMLPPSECAPAQMLLMHRERFGMMINPDRFDRAWAELDVNPYSSDNRSVCHLDVLSNEFLAGHDELISRFVTGKSYNEVMAATPPALSTPGAKLYQLLDRAHPPGPRELGAFVSTLPAGRIDDDLVLPMLWLGLASGDGALACSIARRVIAERPGNRNAHYALVAALFEMGKRGEAAEVADSWCASNHADPALQARARQRLNLTVGMAYATGLFKSGQEMEHALDVAANRIRG